MAMKNASPGIGIDVSKDTLDVWSNETGSFQVRNDRQGVLELAGRLDKSVSVYMEHSGAHERVAVKELVKAGFTVCLLSPHQVSRIAPALGHRAKTDALDARLLAAAGAILKPTASASAEQMELRGLSRHVQGLSRRVGELKRRLKAPGLALEVRDSLERELAFVKCERDMMKRKAKEAVLASSFAERFLLLLTVPGIGEETARVLCVELVEDLTAFTSRQICACSGVAPMDRSSGRKEGHRWTLPGAGRVKAVLYQAALSRLKVDDLSRGFYDRLLAKGRSHKSAMVALMHRLLREAISILKRGRPWVNLAQGGDKKP
jgi:transposase